MSPLYVFNVLLWRRFPRQQRRKLLAKLEHHLPKKTFQRLLSTVGSGIYRQEVLDTRILFIHVPKAAGTSVVLALYNLQGIGHCRAVTARAMNPVLFEQLYCFAVIRNPWERLISAYRFAKQGGTNEVPLNNSSALNDRLPDNFQSFVMDWLIHQNPEKLHSLFMPQHLFVCDKQGKLLVDDIYDVNDLDTLASDLSKRMARDVIIPHTNVTKRADDMAHHYHSDELIEAVGKFYAKDVTFFNYAPPALD